MEVDLPAILDLVGSDQFISCPQSMSFFWRLCPLPVSNLGIKCNTTTLGCFPFLTTCFPLKSKPKEAKIYSGKKTTSLTSGAGKTGQPLVKE